MKNATFYKILGATLLALVFFLIGIVIKNSKPTSNLNFETNKIKITTSFYPLYFFASQIAGDKATVYNITPAGAEPHDYEPTTQDMARIEDSQILILNGGKLEAWGDKIRNSLLGTKTQVITLGDEYANQTIIEDGANIRDPHVWLDPVLAKKEADSIAKELESIDADNATYYEKNLQELNRKFDSLDTDFRIGLAKCQEKNIITSHAAFGYLAREYGLNQVSISGLSPDEEPSPQKLVDVASFAKKNNINYIFFESLVSPKLSQTIAQEIGAQTLVLNPIEGLSNQEIAAGKNYLTEMQANLTNLKIALQCQ